MISLYVSHGFGSGASLHPYYQDMLRQLPKGVCAANNVNESEYWKKEGGAAPGALLRLASFGVNVVGLPNVWPVRSDADALYCCQHLPLTCKRWILDVDHPAALVRYKHRLQRSPLSRLLVRRMVASSRCLGVVFWSDAARRAFLAAYPVPSGVQRKMHVIYPTATWRGEGKRASGYNLLFVSNIFHQKGAMDALEAFRLYHDANPRATLTFVSNVPDNVKKRYAKCGVVFKERMPREKLLREYAKADAFVYPTRMDIFGLVILEALSFGLPVITTADFCTRELVRDGKTGVIVARSIPDWFDSDGLMAMDCDFGSADYVRVTQTPDETLVSGLVRAMETLSDARVRERMRSAIKKDLARFAPEKRTKELAKILYSRSDQ
jgi:glycosyltransferase involved in cell wall biosynthesis